MKDNVDFQSHSQFHPILPSCEDKLCEKEIYQSKKDLEVVLNSPQKHFAYPNED